MKHYYGYRWSCLTKDILLSVALIIAIIFFDKFQGVASIVIVVAIIIYRLILGAYPIQSITIDEHSVTINRPWFFTPSISINTKDITDFTPMTIAGIGNPLALGSNIITESGSHTILKNGVLDYEKLHFFMTESFSKNPAKNQSNKTQ